MDSERETWESMLSVHLDDDDDEEDDDDDDDAHDRDGDGLFFLQIFTHAKRNRFIKIIRLSLMQLQTSDLEVSIPVTYPLWQSTAAWTAW